MVLTDLIKHNIETQEKNISVSVHCLINNRTTFLNGLNIKLKLKFNYQLVNPVIKLIIVHLLKF